MFFKLFIKFHHFKAVYIDFTPENLLPPLLTLANTANTIDVWSLCTFMAPDSC